MKRILTPIDFSGMTPRVLEEAGRLARGTGASVVLLHVARLPAALSGYVIESASAADLTTALERTADLLLAEAKSELREQGINVQSLRLTGDPVEDILDQAEKLSADYIVIGSRGHTALYDVVIGSTASAVLKRAPCPVVLVPAATRISVSETIAPPTPIEAL